MCIRIKLKLAVQAAGFRSLQNGMDLKKHVSITLFNKRESDGQPMLNQ